MSKYKIGQYWVGKKKDQYTIDRLSESKYKKIIQYDKNGNLVKIWNSAKEIAEQVFHDYIIVNGGSRSKIYSIIDTKQLNKRFINGSYWFKYDEIIKKYNYIVPLVIDLSEKWFIERLPYSHTNSVYYIIEYDENNKIIKKHYDAFEISTKMGVHVTTIRKYCRCGIKLENGHLLKYGKKHMVK